MHQEESCTPYSDAIVRMLASPYPNDPQGRTFREVTHDRLAEVAAAGCKAAAKELREWDRVFGPRPQKGLSPAS
jgi:hypothetical protein